LDVLHRPNRKDDKIFTIKATLAASKRVFDIFRWKREQVAEDAGS
jgi:hypothetical protein